MWRHGGSGSILGICGKALSSVGWLSISGVKRGHVFLQFCKRVKDRVWALVKHYSMILEPFVLDFRVGSHVKADGIWPWLTEIRAVAGVRIFGEHPNGRAAGALQPLEELKRSLGGRFDVWCIVRYDLVGACTAKKGADPLDAPSYRLGVYIMRIVVEQPPFSCAPIGQLTAIGGYTKTLAFLGVSNHIHQPLVGPIALGQLAKSGRKRKTDGNIRNDRFYRPCGRCDSHKQKEPKTGPHNCPFPQQSPPGQLSRQYGDADLTYGPLTT